ncbi:hypothetical protein [Methylovulum miyakonense]|uniref:hypothetical protein n=1 Tax=Methylovulum miyakonense TaxID=645578 RepID=UPI00036D69F5|nr:hypothetical protein [Methylovulum miyakonense]
MELRVGLLLLAAFLPAAHADANMTGLYTLPASKVYIEPCQREALLLHPGIIEKQRVLHRHGDFWVRYEILARDGSESVVQCDLANGRIIREQKLIDGSF